MSQRQVYYCYHKLPVYAGVLQIPRGPQCLAYYHDNDDDGGLCRAPFSHTHTKELSDNLEGSRRGMQDKGLSKPKEYTASDERNTTADESLLHIRQTRHLCKGPQCIGEYFDTFEELLDHMRTSHPHLSLVVSAIVLSGSYLVFITVVQ
ncbi:hypothetical protein EIP91_010627 [Steccherinum ochraceum]|uniref:Uncharacterized protein n=1 Tax=Steccherinum ochraceum TaxID=92696 RepID=A0A4R0R2J7_9APHY|nr:hypothetical protein EIP91_010627 [Steccherinum ochraceum]